MVACTFLDCFVDIATYFQHIPYVQLSAQRAILLEYGSLVALPTLHNARVVVVQDISLDETCMLLPPSQANPADRCIAASWRASGQEVSYALYDSRGRGSILIDGTGVPNTCISLDDLTSVIFSCEKQRCVGSGTLAMRLFPSRRGI